MTANTPKKHESQRAFAKRVQREKRAQNQILHDAARLRELGSTTAIPPPPRDPPIRAGSDNDHPVISGMTDITPNPLEIGPHARILGLLLAGFGPTAAARVAYAEARDTYRALGRNVDSLIASSRRLAHKHALEIARVRARTAEDLLSIPIARADYRLRQAMEIAEEARASGQLDTALAAQREARREMEFSARGRGTARFSVTLDDVRRQLATLSITVPVDAMPDRFRDQALDTTIDAGSVRADDLPDDAAGGLPSPLAAARAAEPVDDGPDRVDWVPRPGEILVEDGEGEREWVEATDEAGTPLYWDDGEGAYLPVPPPIDGIRP